MKQRPHAIYYYYICNNNILAICCAMAITKNNILLGIMNEMIIMYNSVV